MSGLNSAAQENIATQQQAQNTQPAYATRPTSNAASDVFSRASRSTLSGNAASGSLTELKENLTQALKDLDAGSTYELHVLNDSSLLALPAVLIASKRGGQVKYYSVVAESLLHFGKIDSVEEYVNNIQVKVDMPAAKVWDGDYRAIVGEWLAKRYNVDAAQVSATYFFSLDKSRDLTDASLSHAILDTAVACIDEFFEPSAPVQRDFLTHADIDVSLSTDWHGGETIEFASGEAIAADATLSVVAKERRNEKYRLNGGGHSATLVKTAVRVDLIKQDLRADQFGHQFAGQFGQQNEPNRAYHPVIIMADSEGLNSDGGRSIENVHSFALSVASTALLATGQNFMNLFTRSPKKKAMLANLGYVHNPMGPLTPAPLKIEDGFQPQTEGAWIPSWIHGAFFHTDSITLAADIRLGGRSAWTQQLPLAVANGDGNANGALIQVFEDLFPGFANAWTAAGGGPLVNQATVDIHNGTYQEKSGDVRDIREIDYLHMAGVLKEGAADPAAGVDNYAHSLLPGATSGSEGLLRLHRRRVDIATVTGNAEFTGLSKRVFFHPQLMNVLVSVMAANNIRLNPEDLGADQSQQQLLAAFQHGTALSPQQASSVFQQQYGQTNNQNVYQHNATGFYCN